MLFIYLVSFFQDQNHTAPLILGLLISGAVFIHYLFARIYNIKFDPKSSVITSLSIAIILRSNFTTIYLICLILSVSSKFLITQDKRHFFNPANFGIVISLLFLNAWISPSALKIEHFIITVLICSASLILSKARTYLVSASFFITFVSLQFIWNLWLNKPIAILIHDISQPTLIIFTFFMISDPKTVPKEYNWQIIFGFIVGSMSFCMKYLFYNTYGILYSLFIVASLNMILAFMKKWRYQNEKCY